MRILHLSDTHGKHHELSPLPAADVVVHSGDFTFSGSDEEALDFLEWLCDLPHRHKVFVAGNHDMCMYDAEQIEGLPENVHYLCHSGVVIEGLKFWGVPLFMEDCMSGTLVRYYAEVPSDTDILITHQPPRGMCDLADYGSGLSHHGDPMLLSRVKDLDLLYHLFGHEHDANSVCKQSGTVFSNASVLDRNYRLSYKPRLFIL